MPQVGVALLVHGQEHAAPPGHPENAGRLSETITVIDALRAANVVVDIELQDHDQAPIERVHKPEYVRQIAELAAAGGGRPDLDTFVTPKSFLAATSVVSATLSAVDAAMNGGMAQSLILGRPPGHHAEADHARGFCLFNTVGVAAQYAIDTFQLARVAIVDFDVHHGNGSQHMFYDRADVIFISTHQFPFYPGSGSAGERGGGPGLGFTLNFPLWVHTGDAHALPLFEKEIRDALLSYNPQLLLVSAGFDAHRLDPLAGLDWSSAAYEKIGRVLRDVAFRCCDGRMISVLEGGYNPAALADSIHHYIEGLTDK